MPTIMYMAPEGITGLSPGTSLSIRKAISALSSTIRMVESKKDWGVFSRMAGRAPWKHEYYDEAVPQI